MRQKQLTIITLVASATFSYAQGTIDIDTGIQMGVAGTEHVKITDTNFSVHQDAANPLIYGDFGTGGVGIGTANPTATLEVNGSTKVNGSETVSGDVSFRNIVHDFARYVSVPGGGYYDFIFTTYFSAGMTIEVTTTGIVGGSASTMNTEKHAFQFYMYSNNMGYQYNKISMYQLGEEIGYLDTNISAVGSGHQFRVRVSNAHSNPYNATVHIHVVKMSTPVLAPQF